MGNSRALPDLRTAIKVDKSSLVAAEQQANISGAKMGSSLAIAGKGAKAAEKDIALMEKRMAMAGVETGKLTGLMGVGGAGLTPMTLAAAGGVVVLVAAAKSMTEISEKWEEAQRGLNQAVEVGGWDIGKARQQVDDFIGTNKEYIKDQSEVVAGMAAIARGGIDQNLSQKMLNVALDLSAIKHISLQDAITAVTAAEQGRGKALKELGISMKDYGDLTLSATQANQKVEASQKALAGTQQTLAQSQHALSVAQHNLATAHDHVLLAQQALSAAVKAHGAHSAQAQAASRALAQAQWGEQQSSIALSGAQDNLAKDTATLKDAEGKLTESKQFMNDKSKQQAELLDSLAEKTKGGRDTMDDLEKAQNRIGGSWQHLSHVAGPPLMNLLGLIVKALADGADIIETWITIIGKLIQKVKDLVTALSHIKMPSISLPNIPGFGRAGGGPVVPGNVYTVGENGPETLWMNPGGGGGMVIPGGGGGGGGGGAPVVVHSHLYLDGKQIDEHVQTVIAGPGGQAASGRGFIARNRGLAGA